MKKYLFIGLVLLTGFACDGFDEGVNAAKSGDYKTAFIEFKKLAEQGDALAQFNLALMYSNGQGVPQDYKEAVKWYRKAAVQGDTISQFNLAAKYRKGQGVPQDYKEAIKWYQKAAEQGYADAQYNLALMYAKGQGIPPSYFHAHIWFSLAAAGGHGMAGKYRDIAAKKMTPAQIAKAQKLAREWKPKH